MGVNAKVVIVGNLNIQKIGNIVIQALHAADVDYKKQYCIDNGNLPLISINLKKEPNERMAILVRIHSYDFNSFSIIFSMQGENRSVFFHPNAEYDYKELNPNNKNVYSFSIGHWGCSDKVIDTIREALKDQGKVYYTYSDSKEEFEEMPHNEVAKATEFDMKVQELVDLVSTHQSVKALEIIKRQPPALAAYALGFVISHKDTPDDAKNWLMNALYNG